MAKERGARVVRDIWEEQDDGGKVRFAQVQTVSPGQAGLESLQAQINNII